MRTKGRWSELSRRRRAAIVAAATVQLGLQGDALVDLARRDADRVNGPRTLWVALSFVNFLGPLAYFAWGRRGDTPPG